ncbi:hypothetical protein [uncultured Leifsonia sp.]|uniref:hypothetical protein n=1 Tax=uncultured Leifsonia sp. TaxID=340359 RepID=UPI0028D1A1AF|nr:hypothetical protein [uncultured Leifsonia sp.]
MTALRTPAAAVAWALAQPRWEHAMCLEFVWRCYAPDDSISSRLSAYGFPPPIARAIDGWTGSPLKHADRSPQLGAPVYYSAASSGATAGDGHVAIYVGNGMIRSTDAGGYGINATVPLDWPERAWGRRLLGWTGDILGHDLRLGTAPAGTGPATPIPPKREDEDVEGFYIRTRNDGPVYWFSPATGKLRAVSSGEWSFLRAVETTAGGLQALGRPLPIITVSDNWLGKAKQL